MVKVERTITIHAPAKKVFDYIAGTTTLLEVWPGMIEAKDVKTLPNGGHRFHWAYKMAGVRFEGDSEDVEFVANKRIVSEGGNQWSSLYSSLLSLSLLQWLQSSSSFSTSP
mgnify:CR=1 FL=1